MNRNEDTSTKSAAAAVSSIVSAAVSVRVVDLNQSIPIDSLILSLTLFSSSHLINRLLPLSIGDRAIKKVISLSWQGSCSSRQ